jgi:hypothetical protein
MVTLLFPTSSTATTSRQINGLSLISLLLVNNPLSWNSKAKQSAVLEISLYLSVNKLSPRSATKKLMIKSRKLKRMSMTKMAK